MLAVSETKKVCPEGFIIYIFLFFFNFLMHQPQCTLKNCWHLSSRVWNRILNKYICFYKFYSLRVYLVSHIKENNWNQNNKTNLALSLSLSLSVHLSNTTSSKNLVLFINFLNLPSNLANMVEVQYFSFGPVL